jgi:acyl-coenzyme A synthetase/AMP-(fatty) acid ligase
VNKGDRVVIYLPMSVEGVVAMQACARIGAPHCVVFGGFSGFCRNKDDGARKSDMICSTYFASE